MKKFKKIVSFLLTMAMVLAMTTNVFAAQGTNSNTGTITIDNAVKDQEYTIYQILVLESYNTDSKAYSYKVADAWKDWIKKDGNTVANDYLTVDANGYVTWKGNGNADAAAFAKEALKYAKDNGIKNAGSTTATDSTVTFEGLNLGYYLVDTTLGTLCSLDTTNPSVIMNEKNTEPTIEKKVQEDSSEEWGDQNTAQIGDTVNFKTTVKAYKGAQNYVVHDAMSEGLTLNTGSISIAGATETTDYTVNTNPTDGCSFEIVFTETYLNKISGTKETPTEIVITYSAVLNEKAAISTDSDSNTNKTKLDYGNAGSTEWDETKTYTFKFEIIKTDANNKLLDGAEFELYDKKTEGNKIALVKEGDSVYHVATSAEQQKDGFVSAVIEAKDGKATIKGLDADTTYYLEETKAPAGYNKLAARVDVKIEKANLTATLDNAGTTWVSGGVHIINQTGTELPSTGGMGTTVLYIAGVILVLAAVVLLFARRRMSREA